MDVREGLGQSGDLSQGDFDDLLAQQAAKSRTEEGDGAVETRGDPSEDSADQIARDILSGPVSVSVRDGLTVHERMPAELESRLSPEAEKYLEIGERLNAQEEKALQRGAEALEQLAVREYVDRFDAAADDSEIIAALLALKEKLPESFVDYEVDLARQLTGVYDSDAAGREELDDLARTTIMIDELVNQAEAYKADDLATERMRQLLPLAQEASFKDKQDVVREWRHEQGIQPAEAKERIGRAAEFARDILGIDLMGLDKADFDKVLRASDATVGETVTAQRTRALHEQILNAPSTNVGNGIEKFGPNGWRRVNAVDMNATFGPVVPNPARTAQRMVSRRTSESDIHRGVLEASTSVKDGLTSGGKRITIPEATGENDRYEQERREDIARARSMGLFRR